VWRRSSDVWIVVAIFVGASLFGARELRQEGNRLDFYQIEYGPAVALACGRGYVNPIDGKISALHAFLRTETTTFDCRSLPADLPVDPQLNTYHRTARYLIGAVALVWRITGVSWSAVTVFAALLFAATSVAVYALARLAMGRLLSATIAVAITGSTLNLLMLRYLRDYAKAPFILWSIFLMACLVTRASTRGRAVAIGGAGGVVVAIGFGFRNDLLMVVVPFLVTTAFLLPRSANFSVRASACAAFIAAFLIVAAPVLADYAGGSNTGHVAVLGLTEPFDHDLGIRPAIYQYGHHYLDTLANAIVTTYADRFNPRPGGIAYLTPEYDAAAASYLLQIARTCPADLIVRTYAAMASMPYLFLEQYQYPALPGRVASAVYKVRGAVNWKLRRLAPWTVAAAIALTALANLRAAAFMLLIVVVLMGGTAIQFHARHFFYFEFVPLWAFGFMIARAGDALSSARGTAAPLGLHRGAVLRGVLFIAVVSAGAMGTLWLARAYQTRQLIALFSTLESAPRQLLPVRSRPLDSGRVLLTAERPRPEGDNGDRIKYQYLMIEADLAACGITGPLRIRARYDAATDAVDLSQEMPLRAGRADMQPVQVLYPVYEREPDLRFAGFDVDAAVAPCVRISNFVDPRRFPLLLTAELADDWRHELLYQTLTWH